ncbi:MAG: shikimate kinase [Synechococcales cyanobacterium]
MRQGEGDQTLKGVNIYLIGMMGSGKTTLGQSLATRLGYAFVDTDQVIEQSSGQTIPELFAQGGEAHFRDWETQVLNQVSGFRSVVVATGGGIVERPENWGSLHHGVVVWLDVPLSELLARLAQDPGSRPLLQTLDPAATLATLWERRQPLYAQADVRVDLSGLSPQAAVEILWQEICARLRPEQDRGDASSVFDSFH